MRIKRIIILCIIIAALAAFFGCSGSEDGESSFGLKTGKLSSTEDINLQDVDGGGWSYTYTYDGEEYRAQYIPDCWTLFDSYKITNSDDQEIICQALIDTHTVHGKDMESYRTADDMVYEWKQHNLAYKYLPEDNAWRECAQNVDFDPWDQGRSFSEIYEDRTGKEFDLKKYVKEGLESGELMEHVEDLFQKKFSGE